MESIILALDLSLFLDILVRARALKAPTTTGFSWLIRPKIMAPFVKMLLVGFGRSKSSQKLFLNWTAELQEGYDTTRGPDRYRLDW